MLINRINILNTFIDNLSMQETLGLVDKAILNKKLIHHCVVNAAKIVSLQKNEELKKSINNSDIINADGQSVVWASKILNNPLKERVAGIDLMESIVELAAKRNYRIFFLGAEEEVVKKVVSVYTHKYSSKIIAGFRNGYFKRANEKEIAQEIEDSEANILFVAIKSPIKENFLFHQKNTLKSLNFIMGVGGSFDVIAGKVSRAPKWIQKAGFEWLFRLIQEPKRLWKRYLIGNSKFLGLVFKEKFFKKPRKPIN